ncbi:MAG: transglutaminase domain-containing protein, partial [Anaerovoracaceae bacterium]
MNKKPFLKRISALLIAALLICALPAESSYGLLSPLSQVGAPAKVTTFKSTADTDAEEYLRAYVTTADDHVLKVIYRTPLETSLFRLSLYRVGENKGDVGLDIFIAPTMARAGNGTETYNFTYYLNMDEHEIEDGYYNIYIRRCATAEDAASLKYTNSGVLNKNMEIYVKDGQVRILRYMDVINYNRQVMEIGALYDTSLYLDNSLEDIRFVLRNPATGIYSSITAAKQSYIRSVANRITAGITTDYEKLRAIYEYTAGNFYYDSVAFQTHNNQYCDPYENIFSFETGRTGVNSQSGRVYTTCQGYSAIFIALARAQGIPARLVYGHRLAVPSNDWRTEQNIDVRDHWWVEAYVDGRWIFVDPTVGTTNAYNSSTDKWTTTGVTNYTYFDPTEEQIAHSHVYMNIYPDYRYGKYISNPYEVETLRGFLNTSSGGTLNGKILNSSYDPYDKETWGDGVKSHFMTDGSGNVTQIQWSNYGFTGALNLPDFTSMELLSSWQNNYETVDLSGCTKLGKVYLYGNQITSIDLTDCPSLWYVRAQNNPMKRAALYVNGRNRTITAGENGTFYFTLDTRYTDSALSLYSAADIGYKLQGIYNAGTGKLLSAKTAYHFTLAAADYEIRFTLDPDSYKYTLYPGDGSAAKLPYIQAAAKRLAALGYYTPPADAAPGEETSYTAAMAEAAKKFQVMKDLKNTGNIASLTWKALFSEDAPAMVSDGEYETILAEYQARKAAQAEAENIMNGVSIKASSEAGKGYIKVSWTCSAADYVDGYEVWKSTARTGGYQKMFTTSKQTYKNTSGLKKGTRYYYKVRAYKEVGGKIIYSGWS